MAILVIGAPEELPPDLSENPEVVVIDPATLDPALMEQLVTAAGGMIEDVDGEQNGGEGTLSEWAGEEEKEHGMGGYGDEEEDPEKRMGGEGYGDEEEDPEKRMGMGGRGDEEEERRPLPPPSGQRGGQRGGRAGAPKFSMSISGKGAAIPALSQWASSFGAPARR